MNQCGGKIVNCFAPLIDNIGTVHVLLLGKLQGSRLVGRRIGHGTFNNVIGNSDNLRTVFFLPFPKEGALHFGHRAIVPAAVLQYGRKLPGLSNACEAQKQFVLDFAGQDILVHS
jgi:hypothetical protein